MQRKNNFLKISYYRKQKTAMAMIMAVAVIVVLGTIMALSLSMTTQTSKRTTDIYLYEQAVLYSKSTAELALLKIAEDGCQNTYNTNFDGIYDANITMRYVYTTAETNTTGGSCNEYIGGPNPTDYIQTPEQNGSVLMDITVSTNQGTEPIRYFRRTIQKL